MLELRWKKGFFFIFLRLYFIDHPRSPDLLQVSSVVRSLFQGPVSKPPKDVRPYLLSSPPLATAHTAFLSSSCVGLSFIDGKMDIEFVSTFCLVTFTRGTQHVFRGPTVESQVGFLSRVHLRTVLATLKTRMSKEVPLINRTEECLPRKHPRRGCRRGLEVGRVFLDGSGLLVRS